MRYHKFTSQQKLSAVLRSEIVGVALAAKELGVGPTTLYQWRKDFAPEEVVTGLRATVAKGLAKPWPGRALRVCVDGTDGGIHRLLPRGANVPAGSAMVPTFQVTTTAPARRAYSDGFLCAKASALGVHRQLLERVSAEIAGSDQHAAEMIGFEVTRRLGADMSEAEIRIANRAARALREAGFYDHAETDSQMATVAALVARDLMGAAA